MKTIAPVLMLALLAACQTTDRHDHLAYDYVGLDPRVDDDVYVHVPEADRKDVDEARTESLRSKDEVAQAQHEVDLETKQLRVAKDELDNAKDSVDIAQREFLLANDTTHDDHDDYVKASQERLDQARQRLQAARAKVALHEVRLEQQKADVTLAKLQVELAESRIELAKAKAVYELDRPGCRDLPLRDFEAAVADRETRLKMAEVDAEAWNKKIELRQKMLDDRRDDVGDEG
jgi:chromosome segregation ATPase